MGIQEQIQELERKISYIEVELLEDGFGRHLFRQLESLTIERLELFKQI